MPINFRDSISFLFGGGRGIEKNQIIWDGVDADFDAAVTAVSAVTVYNIALGWSADRVPIASEFTVTSDTDTLTVPTNPDNDYIVLWTDDTHGPVTGVFVSAAPFNELNTYGSPIALTLSGEAGHALVTVNRRNAALLSGETIRVVF